MPAITPVGVRLVVQNFGQFSIQMSSVGSSLARLGGLGSTVSAGFTLINSAMRAMVTVAGVTAAALAGVGIGIYKIAKGSVEEANSFETSYAGMLKTVAELTDPATNKINELGETVKQEFRDMAREIPVTFEELARIGTIAGQMDIPAEALAGFTKNIAAIAVSTDLTADEATTNFATIAKIFQVSEDDMVQWSSQFGSALVQLGNNFAVMEPEILSFAERIAGAGAALGLTETDIIAIGAAFGQSGVQMQRGGTAVQKVLIKMNEAMQDGGKEIDKIAKVAMPNMKDATEAFLKLDPAEQFRLFTEGLAQQGPEAVQILKELELGDQRLLGAFLNVSSAQGELTRAMKESDEAFQSNTALARESEIFYSTYDNQLQITKNKVDDLKVSLGEQIKEHFLAPIVSDAQGWLDTIRPELETAFSYVGPALEEHLLPALSTLFTAIFGEVDWENFGQTLGEKIAGHIETFSGFIETLAANFITIKEKAGEFKTKLDEIEEVTGRISGHDIFKTGLEVAFDMPEEKAEGITKWVEGISTFLGLLFGAKAIAGFVGMIQSIGPALGIATGPVGWLITAIAALIALVVTNWDTLKTAFSQLGFIIAYYAKVAWAKIKEFFGGIGAFFTETIPSWWEGLKDKVAAVWDKIKEAVSSKWDSFVKSVQDKIENFKTKWSEFWGGLRDKIAEFGQKIKEKFDEFLEKIGITDEIKERWRQIGENLRLIISTIWENIKTAIQEKVEAIKQWLSDTWEKIKTAFSTAWETISDTATRVWDKVKTAFSTAWDNIKTSLKTKWEEIKTSAIEKWEGIKAKIIEIWEKITDPIVETWNTVKQKLTEKFDEMRTAFVTAKDKFIEKVTTFVADVKRKFGEIVTKIKTIGKDIIDGLIQGLKDNSAKVINYITGLVEDIIDAALSWLGIKSPSSVFKGIGKFILDGMIVGMNDRQRWLNKTVTKTVGHLPYVSKSAYEASMQKINNRTSNVTVNANYTETQTPGSIADDLAILNLYGVI